MSLILHGDPQQPAGGYAFLELPEGRLAAPAVTVAIFDAYGERWLSPSAGDEQKVAIGNPNWQAEKYEYGPYKVYRHNGADWVRVGPEIVNKIEAYAPLRISVEGRDYDVSWPDDIPPRALAAVVGGLQTVSRPAAELEDRTVIARKPPAPTVEPTPIEEATPLAEEPAEAIVPPAPEPKNRRSALWLLLILLVLALAGAAFWWFVLRDPADADQEQGTEQTTTGETDTEQTSQVPPPVGDTCTAEALGALQGGFAVIGPALRECGARVSPDVALTLVENSAADEDPEALYLFGMLYDGSQQDGEVEDTIGLTFGADDPKAAEYYARAVAAGSPEAATALAATCARLGQETGTLAKGAHDDYCR